MLLRLYSHGLTLPMVADERGVSCETVKSQTKLIRLKLAAKNTTHAVALAIRAGLIA
jgi:DNA-binding NarL/FixJ family response regulator